MKLLIASYNICSAHFLYGHYTEENLNRLAKSIGDCGADVVCLQEVDRGCARSSGVDMPKALGERAGYPYRYFIRIRPFQGGEYGTAILSKLPFDASGTLDYPVKLATQGTSCGYVRIGELTLFNTHLSVESDEANTETMCCLGEILKKQRTPWICCGDFNTNPGKFDQILPWVHYANKELLTYADRSIDNVLYADSIGIADVRVRDTTPDRITDHNMLLVCIEYEGEEMTKCVNG